MHLALSFALLAGCAVPMGGTDDDDTTLPPVVTPAAGTFAVTSTLDITIEQLLPQAQADLVVTLRDFQHEPAHTLITLADAAGVPAVGTLRAVLPDALEGKLEGWIDDEIEDMEIGGVPVTEFAGTVVELAETALSQVDVESTLEIHGASATHRLTALDLGQRFALGALPDEIVEATTSVSMRGDELVLGDHTFSIAYGRYVWTAIHGAELRALLGSAVNCPLVAQHVAAKCVLGACVGHAAELTSICERGLDEVVARAKSKVEAFRFDALHFASGTATMLDADHLSGTWTAELNAGQGLRHAPATFVGER